MAARGVRQGLEQGLTLRPTIGKYALACQRRVDIRHPLSGMSGRSWCWVPIHEVKRWSGVRSRVPIFFVGRRGSPPRPYSAHEVGSPRGECSRAAHSRSASGCTAHAPHQSGHSSVPSTKATGSGFTYPASGQYVGSRPMSAPGFTVAAGLAALKEHRQLAARVSPDLLEFEVTSNGCVGPLPESITVDTATHVSIQMAPYAGCPRQAWASATRVVSTPGVDPSRPLTVVWHINGRTTSTVLPPT